jgi:dCTP deaminase
MVLSDADLRRAMEEGELEIEPFLETSLTPNGYDLTVECVLVPGTGARTDSGRAAISPGSWFVLSTRERVRLGRKLSAQLWLRTSYARKGVLATFGKIDAGFNGTLTVTAFNASGATVEVPVGERFCQMVLERLDTPAEKTYPQRSGNYQDQKGITLAAWENGGKGARGQPPENGRRPFRGRGPCGNGTDVLRPGARGAPGGAAPARRTDENGGAAGKEGEAQVLEVSEMQLSVPDAGEQPCKRHGCSHCCNSTEMPLTFEDIRRIRALGFEEKYFIKEVDSWFQLRNTEDGHCFFLHNGLCSIYPSRPQGCTFYPVVFDLDKGKIVLDTECPCRDEYDVPRDMHRRVRGLVDRLQRERRDRRRRRPR